MKKTLFLLLLSLLCFSVSGQNKTVDSLKFILSKTVKPIERFDLFNKMVEADQASQGNSMNPQYGIELHKIAQKLDNDSLRAISINVLGNNFRVIGDFPTALHYLFKGIPLAEKSNDKRRLSSLYFDISDCYYVMQNYEESFRYCKIGGENLPAKSSKMYNWMALQYYRSMAKYYLEKNQPDLALPYIHKIEETNNRLINLNRATFNLISLTQYGKAYDQKGDIEMAELYFKKAKPIVDSNMLTPMIFTYNVYYTPYLIKQQRWQEVYMNAASLLKVGKKLKNNYYKQLAASYLSTGFKNLHQQDSAYYYLSMESALKDSIYNQNNLNKIQSITFNEKIRSIEEKAHKAILEQERRNNIQYAFIALGIISFLILFLLLSRSIVVNEKLISFFGILGLLIVFEFINLLIHPFLEEVTHHSPILMLLCLVVLASLLIPLHHKLEKWIKEKMTEKNKAIRLASAKKTIEQLEKI